MTKRTKEMDSVSVEEMRFYRDVVDAMGDGLVNMTEVMNALTDKGSKVTDIAEKIKAIETKLGVEKHYLVNAFGGVGSRVTYAGRLVANGFDNIIKCYDEQVQSRLNKPRLRLTVGATNAASTFLLSEVMAKSGFLKVNRDLDLVVVEGEPWQLQKMVVDRLLDFAIGPRPQHKDPKITLRHLCNWKRVLLYSKIIERYKETFDKLALSTTEDEAGSILKQLLKEETVFVPPPNVMVELDKWLPEPTTGNRVQLPQAAIRRSWASRGLGVAIAHEEQHAFQDSELIGAIDLTPFIHYTEIHLYHYSGESKEDEKFSGKVKELVDHITSYR